ncbi:MAG TPA: hypothetical protein HA257_06290 [Candidatus Methanoperedenaceae archaeon]|nr:hypothetical protein [Candidatus Methanoperedenaceae archaeon]
MRKIKVELRLCSEEEYKALAPELYASGARAFVGWNGEDDAYIALNNEATFITINDKLRLMGHELGHVLGLRDSDEPGIMARGSFWSFLMRLMP